MRPPEHIPSAERHKVLSVESSIESLDGQPRQIRVELGPDGLPKAAAFFDIDGTLADLRFVHFAAIREMYPNADPTELASMLEESWKIRNAYLEQRRMHGIYAEGRDDWRTLSGYSHFLTPEKQQEISSPGNSEHELATGLLQRFSETAARAADTVYREHPERFDQAKNRPVTRLAHLYSRLGIPMSVMTGNPAAMSHAFGKYLGLADQFIDIASIEDMKGMGKAGAIEHLVTRMEAQGIPVPKDRLILVGDSLGQDIGAARGLPEEWHARLKGLLVMRDQAALTEAQQQISGDPELAELVSTVDVSGLMIDRVPLNEHGTPMLSSKYRNQFIERL